MSREGRNARAVVLAIGATAPRQSDPPATLAPVNGKVTDGAHAGERLRGARVLDHVCKLLVDHSAPDG